MSSYHNKIVFITGIAHGLGLCLAKIYHRMGAKVVGVDLQSQNLDDVKKNIPGSYVLPCDVTDKEAVYTMAKSVLADVGAPDIIINNAGVVERSRFIDCDDALLERTMNVNIMAHFWVLKAFLPEMIDLRKGHVCQIASAAGLMGVKGMAAYCASKHAVVGFSDSLRMELEESRIHMTIVCPGFINTGMFDGVKPIRFTPMLDQAKIAKKIVKAIDKDKPYLKAPLMIKLVPLLRACLPYGLFQSVSSLFNVHQSMDDLSKPS